MACADAFAGDEVGEYRNPENARTFHSLVKKNSRRWMMRISGMFRATSIKGRCPFSAYKNIFVLGATEIEKPTGGSHYIVKFDHARPWPLDWNHQIVPDVYLKQLEPITGFPLGVIKTALITGNLPRQVLRFER